MVAEAEGLGERQEPAVEQIAGSHRELGRVDLRERQGAEDIDDDWT